MTFLRIGEVAKRAGVGIETVRFYEREGLLDKPQRSASSYREYEPQVVEVLHFIRRAKELGFALKEIKSLLKLRLDPSATRAQVREEAQSKLADIDAKIKDLQDMQNTLNSLIQKCKGRGSIKGCPILDALNNARRNVDI